MPFDAVAATRALLIGACSETSFEQESKQLESKHAGTQCRLMKGITIETSFSLPVGLHDVNKSFYRTPIVRLLLLPLPLLN